MESTSTGVLVWWLAISSVSVLNLCVFAWVATGRRWRGALEPPDVQRRRRWQLLFAGVFTVGCAFRSFLPRAEAQRICLVDHWISNATIARGVATLAELALVTQCALMLRDAARASGMRSAALLSWPLVPLIVLAEVFSWSSALTTNYLFSVFEEALWALTGTLLVLGLFRLWGAFQGGQALFVRGVTGLVIAYVTFMCTVDVPMYWRRWREAEARGDRYLSLAEGWHDANSRRVVTRTWADWHEEMPWMSLYFSVGVWLSIGLVRHPRFGAPARSQIVTQTTQTLHTGPL